MDITDASNQRLELGIERFLAGDAITFEEVTFIKSKGFVQAISFSEAVHLENASAQEASEKIQRSKLVLEKLYNLSKAFSAAINSNPIKYEFCHDYGKGSILLAHLDNGNLIWHGATKSC
jgi:hypothetical protein